MVVRVVPGGVLVVLHRVQVMSVREVRVMRGLVVIAGVVRLVGLAMVVCGRGVMLRGFLVVMMRGHAFTP